MNQPIGIFLVLTKCRKQSLPDKRTEVDEDDKIATPSLAKKISTDDAVGAFFLHFLIFPPKKNKEPN